jgi:hypothetical protein
MIYAETLAHYKTCEIHKYTASISQQFFFFCSIGISTQDFAFARQQATSPALVDLVILEIGSGFLHRFA